MISGILTQDALRLQRLLTELSTTLRQRRAEALPPQPRYVSYDSMRLSDGRLVKRKKVILMSGGCSVPTCTMCPFTNENNYGLRGNAETLLSQVEDVLKRSENEPDYSMLALYNDGSFFAPKEIPGDVRIRIAQLVARAGVERLTVESLPQFVTTDALTPFVNSLGSVQLEIGIGLQSSNDIVRELLVNTRISRPSFEASVKAMRCLDIEPKIYLMIKPPFLTDAEAITDILDSVKYLVSLEISNITLCPTRVSRNTVAWMLMQAGHYNPPNLWTVVEAVKAAHSQSAVRVACINLRGSDFESIFSSSCSLCADGIVDSLISYSESGDPNILADTCQCRPTTKPQPLDTSLLVQRSLNIVQDCLSRDKVQ